MRVLTSLLVVAALCPLSACYVGNTPPTSRRADAGTAVEDASDPKPEPEDAGAPTPEPKPEDRCASDEECGDDARCVRPEGSRAYCMLIPPPADAGTPDAGPSRCDRDLLCSNRQCGRTSSIECEPVDCGSCGANYTCQEGLGRCEYSGPLWALRVVSARIERCDTNWDQCINVAPPFCSPTLPDPFVRVNGVVTTPASNRCEGTYDQEVGVFEEPRLAAGLVVELEDDDSPLADVRSGDVVCRALLRPTPAELAAGTRTFTCAGGSVTFRFERRR